MYNGLCKTSLHAIWCTFKYIFYFSYSIMKECWADDKQSRPTFQELKEQFDGLISNEVRYRYLRLGSLLDEAVLAQVKERVEAPSLSPVCSDCEQQPEVATEDSAG